MRLFLYFTLTLQSRDGSWPIRLYAQGTAPESGRTNPVEEQSVWPELQMLYPGLLRDHQRVIDLDPKVSIGHLLPMLPVAN